MPTKEYPEDIEQEATKTYLEPEEVEQLEKAATCLRDKLLIRLPGRLGCRISEALGVAVDDIDFKRRTVTIEHLKARIQLLCPNCGRRMAKDYVLCPRCGQKVEKLIEKEVERRKTRTLPVDKETLSMLKYFIQHGGPVPANGKQLLFSIKRKRAWMIYQECAARAGLTQLLRNPETGKDHHVSPHKLRDAFAIHAVKVNDSGDGLRLLQEHLGHASITTTMKYRKVAGEEHKSWYDELWKEKKT